MLKCMTMISPYARALAFTFAFSFSASALSAVPSGSAAPDFSLPGHDGKTYKLSDLKGKFVVLEWFNNDCPYVKKHYDGGNMQALQTKYSAKNVVWLTINSSAPGKQGHLDEKGAKEMVATRKAALTAMLLDPKGEVGRMYDAKTTPHMYIINPEGKLVYQGAIDDKPSANAKTLAEASPIFANALDSAIAGKAIAEASTKPYGCSVKY